jgi:hypothetical protein
MKKILYLLALIIALETSYSEDFYSISSGNWSSPSVWSNVSHTGPASNSFPNSDTDRVYIDLNHRIDYNFGNTNIKSLEINNGYLNFNFGTSKVLVVKGNLIVRENGNLRRIIGTGGFTYDSLEVFGNFENYATGKNFVALYADPNNRIVLSFNGNTSSSIIGEGNWAVSDVDINKQLEKQDTVNNLSNSFSVALSDKITSYSGFMNLISGIYHHNNNSVLYLTSDDSNDFTIGSNAGLDISQGEIRTKVGMLMEDNSSISISNGYLSIGESGGYDLLYGINSSLKITGGEIWIAGVFANNVSNSSVRFDMSGGRMYVLKYGAGSNNVKPGFFITSGSVFTWNFNNNPNQDESRIIIEKQHSGGSLSFSVQTNSHQITGGNLQFGIDDDLLTPKYQSFSISSIAPIWNIEIRESRFVGGNNAALIQLSNTLTCLNEFTIQQNGSFDLNCNNLIIQGQFSNFGRFTPDGEGNNTSGLKKVTFSGDKGQFLNMENPVVNSQGVGTVNNEPFFDFEVGKTTGSVTLGSGTNNDLIVKNRLIFTNINTVPIDSRFHEKFVEMLPPSAGGFGAIVRTGKGHINGKLRLHVFDTTANVTFPVGTNIDYTPMRLDFSGTGGVSGTLEAISYPQDPSNLSDNGLNIDLDKNVKRYWTIQPVDNYNLGARKFDLTLQYVNPNDIRSGADFNKFRQFNATQTPYTMLPVGIKSNILNQSTGNTQFGDFFIAEEPVLPATISGRVINKTTQSPIPNANVDFLNIATSKITSATTDANGDYSLTINLNEVYLAKAWLDKQFIIQYYNGTQNITEAEPVTAKDGAQIDFELKPVPNFSNLISGKVVDKNNNGTAAYVIAYLINSDNYDETKKYEPWTIEALTTDGSFQFEGLTPGKYILHAIPLSAGLVPGYYLKSGFAVRSWLDATQIEVLETTKSYANVVKLPDITTITGTRKIFGTIIGEELKLILKDYDSPMAKKQVSGAMTFSVDENDKVRKYDFSEKGGGYTMSGLPNGNYNLGADKVGYEFYDDGVTVNNGDLEQDIELIPYEENSVKEIGTLSPTLVYPNPADDFINIRLTGSSQNVQLRILDMQGREYMNITPDNTNDVIKVNLRALSAGVYLIQISEGGNISVGTITVL